MCDDERIWFYEIQMSNVLKKKIWKKIESAQSVNYMCTSLLHTIQLVNNYVDFWIINNNRKKEVENTTQPNQKIVSNKAHALHQNIHLHFIERRKKHSARKQIFRQIDKRECFKTAEKFINLLWFTRILTVYTP